MVKSISLAAAAPTLILLASCTASPAWPAGSSFGGPVNVAATAYVVNEDSGTVTPIDTSTRTALAPIKVGISPDAIAITSDGRTVLVADADSHAVTPISTATNRAARPIRVGPQPDAIAITPDGQTAYVANDNSVSRIDIPSGTPARQIKPVNAGYGPAAIAISPDGTTVYVSALFESDSTVESDMPGPMTPIQAATGRPRKPLKPGNNPQAIAISPDGRIAYVANWQSWGTVTPVNLVTGAPEKPIKVGNHPIAIAVGPGELSG